MIRALLGLCLTALLQGCGAGSDSEAFARLKGTDAYFQGPLLEHTLPLLCPLAGGGTPGTLKIEILVRYQAGRGVVETPAWLAERAPHLSDALLLHFSDLSFESLQGVEGRRGLRQDLIRVLDPVAFPDGRGRIRDLLFPVFEFQPTPPR